MLLAVLLAAGCLALEDPAGTRGPALSIVTAAIPISAESTVYSVQFKGIGGVPPYRWSAPIMPAGLRLSEHGAVSGFPQAGAAGEYDLKIELADSERTISKTFHLIVDRVLRVEPPAPPRWLLPGQPWSYAFQARGGTPPLRWSLDGIAPLPLDSVTGVMAGTIGAHPGAPFTFRVVVRDQHGFRASEQATIIIPAPFAVGTGPAYLTINRADRADLVTNSGALPISWRFVSGMLPPGVLLDTVLGQLFGTATQQAASIFQVEARDGLGRTATGDVRVQTVFPLAIITPSLPPGRVGQPYSATLTTNSPAMVVFDVVPFGNVIPNTGLAWDAGGTLSGTPRIPGVHFYQVTAFGPGGPSASRLLGVTIQP